MISIQEAYNISDDRIAMFNPVGERRKLEEKLSVTRRNINSFTLKTLRVRASGELSELRYQFTSFMVSCTPTVDAMQLLFGLFS